MATPSGPGPADDIEDRDPGLARERTVLAWTRTAISFVVLGAAMLRTSAVAGVVVIVIGTAAWGLGHVSAWNNRPDTRPSLDPRHTVRLIAGATTLTAVLALVLVLLAPAGGHV